MSSAWIVGQLTPLLTLIAFTDSLSNRGQTQVTVSDSAANLLVSAVLAPAGVAALISQWFSARNQKASLINSARLKGYAEIYGCLADVQQHCADLRKFLVSFDATDPFTPSPIDFDRQLNIIQDGLMSSYQASVKTINNNSIFVSLASEERLYDYIQSVRAYAEWVKGHIFEEINPVSGKPTSTLGRFRANGLTQEQKQGLDKRFRRLEGLINSLGNLLRKEISVAPVEIHCPEFWPDPRSNTQQQRAYPHVVPEGRD